MGKGSKRRPQVVDIATFRDNWDAIFSKDSMWNHFCEMDQTDLAVLKGQSCNWCGLKENGSLD